jgi:transcription elongation factor Elf1
MARQPEDNVTPDLFEPLARATAAGTTHCGKTAMSEAVRRFQARRKVFPAVADTLVCELCGCPHEGECRHASRAVGDRYPDVVDAHPISDEKLSERAKAPVSKKGW